MPQPVHFQATVEQVTRHTADVASYRLRAAKRLPRFAPGQFIHLTIDPYDPGGFWPESRVFSVANAVTDQRTIQLTISRQGAYTSKILDQLKAGDQVWVKGPYGDFTIDANPGLPYVVLIAGGTGITPFCAFMDATLHQCALPVEQVSLFYGAKTQELLIYRPLSDRCAAEIPGFRVHYFVARQAPTDDPIIQPGHLDLAHIMARTPTPAATGFYLSGPKPMIQTFQNALINSYGLWKDQVRIDAWE